MYDVTSDALEGAMIKDVLEKGKTKKCRLCSCYSSRVQWLVVD
jgi:hypothetical protein